ncbi:MAG: hypothetical protein ABUS57_08450 [Pseudomonadota bacterium]
MKRLALAILTSAILAPCAHAQPSSQTYYAFLRDDGRTWCAFKDPAQLHSAATSFTDAVSVTYASDRLDEVVYRVEPESGDWLVIDRYTPANGGWMLRRTSAILESTGRRVTQEANVRESGPTPLRVVNVTTLDGDHPADLSGIDIPEVPILTRPSEGAFVQVIGHMRSRNLSTLCEAPG